MQIKLLQLNMWAGTKFAAIKEFLRNNDFDILCFQEVAGPQTYIGNIHCDVDCFITLSDILGSNFLGELAITHKYTSNPVTSYLGNAIFYKKSFTLLDKDIFWLKQLSQPVSSEDKTFEHIGRLALRLSLSKDEKTINIVNSHLAW